MGGAFACACGGSNRRLTWMTGVPPSTSAKLPTAGDVIDGKYVLSRLLGQGGMGAVYAAKHLKLGHSVAIKVMLADAANHEAASRFINEGRAAANIQNEHVVRVSDVDEENGYAYMVLELLEGEDLAQVLERERRLPWGVAVGYVLQALDGVRQAHAQGIVHRDLKPSNLFLARRQDGSVVVKVLDFGISKANSSNPLGAAPGALTSTKAMLGSPLYMSPEQLRSSKSVDARADIWATGVILFELITGTLPFLGENLGELFAQILEVDAPLLRTLVPDVPPALEAAVARCLQRRPEHRFQNVAELVRELMPMTSAAFPAAMPFTAMMEGPMVPYASARAPAYMSSSPPPGTRPGPPRPWSSTPGSTGSGTGAPIVTGTVPIGSATPQPYRHTDGALWQPPPPPGNSKKVWVGGALVFTVLIGVGLVGYSARKAKQEPPSAGLSPAVSLASGEVAPALGAAVPPIAATPIPLVNAPPPTAASSAAQVAASASVAAPAPPVPKRAPKSVEPSPKAHEPVAKAPDVPAPKAPDIVKPAIAAPKAEAPKSVQQTER